MSNAHGINGRSKQQRHLLTKKACDYEYYNVNKNIDT